MSRYIDADALAQQVCVKLCTASNCSNVLKIIHEIPTADVVEVVRCKDCKHQRKLFHADARRKEGGYFIYWCDLVDGYSHVCLDDDYCSKGERREDEQ